MVQTKGFGGEDAGSPDDPLDPTGLLTPGATLAVAGIAIIGGVLGQLTALSGGLRPGTVWAYSTVLTLLAVAGFALAVRPAARHIIIPILVLIGNTICAVATWATIDPRFAGALMFAFPLLFAAVLLKRWMFRVQLVLLPVALFLSSLGRVDSWSIYLPQLIWNCAALMLTGLGIRLVRNRAAESLTQVRRLSNTDPLTGLANRRFIDDRAEAYVAGAARARQPIAAFLIDLDHFKDVNDTFGHAVGDQVLVAVAEAICGSIRANDIAARTGGEEFLVIGTLDSMADLDVIAERLHRTVSSVAVPIDSGVVRSPCSIGVACAQPPWGTRPEAGWLWQLVERADDAVYAAKRAGRGRWVLSRRTIPGSPDAARERP